MSLNGQVFGRKEFYVFTNSESLNLGQHIENYCTRPLTAIFLPHVAERVDEKKRSIFCMLQTEIFAIRYEVSG